ncbi:MAG: AAA family ATPase [Alphaproteobacteria bacterium]|nr:AAA family ATPase [Alphaproteobacteria bacterium]
MMGKKRGKEAQSTDDLREDLEAREAESHDQKAEKTKVRIPPLQGGTQHQQEIYDQLNSGKSLLAISGPAGTGKTHAAVHWAMSNIVGEKGRKYKRVFLLRPAVASEDLGYLPGSQEEKLEPYIQPFMDVLRQLGFSDEKITELRKEQRKVIVEAVGYVRGRTLNDAVIIVDEAQNLTESQLRAVATRLGKNAVMIFTGDPDQVDAGRGVRRGPQNAFAKFLQLLPQYKIHSSAVVKIPEDAAVFRHKAVADLVKAWRIEDEISELERDRHIRGGFARHASNGHPVQPSDRPVRFTDGLEFAHGVHDEAPDHNSNGHYGLNGTHRANGEATYEANDGGSVEQVDPSTNGQVDHGDHSPA